MSTWRFDVDDAAAELRADQRASTIEKKTSSAVSHNGSPNNHPTNAANNPNKIDTFIGTIVPLVIRIVDSHA